MNHYYLHTRRRMLERYNIDLTFKEFVIINEAIQGHNKGLPKRFISRKSKRLSKWLILIKNRWVSLYYDKLRNSVVTIVEGVDLQEIDKVLKGDKHHETKLV